MVDLSGSGPASEARVIRVFVSSTFRDMQAEREQLIKRTFPQLRKLCESRGVTWSEVDLRWGVTDEQKAEGRVLPICLDEVRRCRPYFIGLLGDRYGWILQDVEPTILAQEPWLAAYRGRSVTEIEMVCGVLDSPDMAEHAFFYFRDSATSAALRLDPPLEPVAEDASAKLNALKHRIRTSRLPLHEDFRSAEELGKLILADFTGVIDRLFPPDQAPGPLDREAALHDAFASSRAPIYVGGEDYCARLDAHARGDDVGLAVLGASGLGKSALLANWASRYRAAHPDEFVFAHFLGASTASTDWAAIARRLIGELNRRFGMTVPTPDKPDALRKSLADALRMAGALHRIVIVLDGLNQLEDREQARELAWLPRDLPPRVRLIASTLPGRSLDELARRNWQTLELAPLRGDERARLIVDYLAQYSKALADSQVATLAGAPMAGNPLFLTAVLEELRVWGEHETLGSQIRHYLSAPSIDDLFQRILARYEADYDRDRPGLVRDALVAIWAARHGLSEAELLDLLGQDGAPLPSAHWSPLHLAADRSLVSHSGLLGFFHDYLRQAVRERYLPTEGQQRTAHLRLADYFARRDLTARKTAELPWQLAQVQAWERLAELLADLAFLKAAWEHGSYDVRSYWSQVNDIIPGAPLKAYQPIFDSPEQHVDYFVIVAFLLARLNYPKESLRILSYLFQMMDHVNSLDPEIFVTLCIESTINHRALGDWDTVMSQIEMALRVARGMGHRPSLAKALSAQALYLFERGKTSEALVQFNESEALARELGDTVLLVEILNNRSNIIKNDNPMQALATMAETERLVRDLGNKDGLSNCLATQGNVLCQLGRFDQALKKFEEAERTSRAIGHLEGVHKALSYQALVFASRKQVDPALRLFEQAIEICRRMGDKKSLASSLLQQASLRLTSGGGLTAAAGLLDEYERLCAEIGDTSSLAMGLLTRADLLAQQGDRAGALAAFQKAETALRKAGDEDTLANCLTWKAEELAANGLAVEAIQSLKEAEELFGRHGDFEKMALAIFNQARLYSLTIRMPAAALPGMRRALAIAEAHRLASLAQQFKQVIDGIGAHTT